MMSRFMLAATFLSGTLILIALSATGQENSSPKPVAPIYIKMLLPDDPAAPDVEWDSAVESWILESIDKEQRQANHRAVTGWIRVVTEPFEGTPVWPGEVLDGVSLCHVGADLLAGLAKQFLMTGTFANTILNWNEGGPHPDAPQIVP